MLDRIKAAVALGGLVIAIVGGIIAYVEFRKTSADADYKAALRSIEMVKETELLDRDLRIAASEALKYPDGCKVHPPGEELEDFRREVRGMIHGTKFGSEFGRLVEHFRNVELCSRHGICDEDLLHQEICPFAIYWSETVTWLFLADGYQGFEDAYAPLVNFALSCPAQPDELYGAPCGRIVTGTPKSEGPQWMTEANERFTFRP